MKWNKKELLKFIGGTVYDLHERNPAEIQIDKGPDSRNNKLRMHITPETGRVNVSIIDKNNVIYADIEIVDCLSIETDTFYNRNDRECKTIIIKYNSERSFDKGQIKLGISDSFFVIVN